MNSEILKIFEIIKIEAEKRFKEYTIEVRHWQNQTFQVAAFQTTSLYNAGIGYREAIVYNSSELKFYYDITMLDDNPFQKTISYLEILKL